MVPADYLRAVMGNSVILIYMDMKYEKDMYFRNLRTAGYGLASLRWHD